MHLWVCFAVSAYLRPSLVRNFSISSICLLAFHVVPGSVCLLALPHSIAIFSCPHPVDLPAVQHLPWPALVLVSTTCMFPLASAIRHVYKRVYVVLMLIVSDRLVRAVCSARTCCTFIRQWRLRKRVGLRFLHRFQEQFLIPDLGTGQSSLVWGLCGDFAHLKYL